MKNIVLQSILAFLLIEVEQILAEPHCHRPYAINYNCSEGYFCCGQASCCAYWWIILAIIVGFFGMVMIPAVIYCCWRTYSDANGEYSTLAPESSRMYTEPPQGYRSQIQPSPEYSSQRSYYLHQPPQKEFGYDQRIE